MQILEHLNQLSFAHEKFTGPFIQTLSNKCRYSWSRNSLKETTLAMSPRLSGGGHRWSLSMSFTGRKVKCLEPPSKYLSFTHTGSKWKTGKDPTPTVPCPCSCSVLSFFSDLNFTMLSFLSQDYVLSFLVLPNPLLHTFNPYLSIVKHGDCHESGLIYWILLNLYERSPWASTGCGLESKFVRNCNLKTLVSVVRRCP